MSFFSIPKQWRIPEAALRQSMAVTGRAWALERFTQKRQLDETQQLYVEILERKLASRVSGREKRFSAEENSGRSVAARRIP